MHKLTFYPLGNADCCLIDVADGAKKILFDFGDMRNPDDPRDRRIDLTEAFRDDFRASGNDAIDVVAFTHLDKDHICGATELFELEHALKYQGEGRIPIRELWVPAAAIIDDVDDEAKILRAEARYRLKNGKRIRVFSRPDLLNDWFKKEGIAPADRAACLVDAGQIVPTFNLVRDGVEFFVHSPFGHRLNEAEVVERNRDSIMVQGVFEVNRVQTKVLLASDIPHEHLDDIIKITRTHGRPERLEWDVTKLPHHCSYLSLASEKGITRTEPLPNIRWLYEKQSRQGAIVVSTSWPIPTTDEVQPPHFQAANYYRGIVPAFNGKFVVTMEHPTVERPEPLVIIIDETKARIGRPLVGTATVLTHRAARAG